MVEGGTSEPRAVMVIGKTGSGKSTLCNVLLGASAFPVGRGGLSRTRLCRAQTAVVRGRRLTMVDTPGTRDVHDREMPLDELRKAMESCPEGIDAFILVVRCDVRMTNEECKAMEDVVEVFGSESVKRAILVFTHGDDYNNDESEFGNNLSEMRRTIPRLDQLLTKIGDRWLLMDNGSRCDSEVRERQVRALMSKVDSVARLNPVRYSRNDVQRKKEKKNADSLKEEMKQMEGKIHKLELQRQKDKRQVLEKEHQMEKLVQRQSHELWLQRERDLRELQEKEHQMRENIVRLYVQEQKTNAEEMQKTQSQEVVPYVRNNHRKETSLGDVLESVGEGVAMVLISPFVLVGMAVKAIVD